MLEGVVSGRDGAPLAGARIEIWQADMSGISLHPDETRLAERDPGFQGFGRTVTDTAARSAFRPIRPIRPSIHPSRKPHIHLHAVTPGGRPDRTTRAYFPDEPGNVRDKLLRGLPAASRALLTVRLEAIDGGQRAIFDVVLG